MAKMEAASVKAATERPAKAGILKRPRSNMGSLLRASLTKKPTMSTAAPTRRPTIVALPQPRSLPRTSANTSANKLAENVTNPTQSTWRTRVSFDSAILANVMRMATTPMGTLTKKIQRHPMPLVMAPPISGPTATAPPMTAP